MRIRFLMVREGWKSGFWEMGSNFGQRKWPRKGTFPSALAGEAKGGSARDGNVTAWLPALSGDRKQGAGWLRDGG